MDLTPSQPVNSGDEPYGEPLGPTSEVAADSPPPAHLQPPHLESQVESRLHRDGTASRSSKEIGGRKFRVGADDDYVPFRNRTKRRRRLITTGAVVLVLIGAGAYGVGSLIGSPSQDSTASSCSKANAAAGAADVAAADAAVGAAAADAHVGTVSGAVQLPAAAQIKLNVYNSTSRHGLAASAATVLKQRGFAIGKVTNDPLKANLSGAAEVRGASANSAAMRVVAAEVVGAKLHADSRTDDSIDLVLGNGFTALASPDQVSAALKQAQQAAQAPQGLAQGQAQTQGQAAQKVASKCS